MQVCQISTEYINYLIELLTVLLDHKNDSIHLLCGYSMMIKMKDMTTYKGPLSRDSNEGKPLCSINNNEIRLFIGNIVGNYILAKYDRTDTPLTNVVDSIFDDITKKYNDEVDIMAEIINDYGKDDIQDKFTEYAAEFKSKSTCVLPIIDTELHSNIDVDNYAKVLRVVVELISGNYIKVDGANKSAHSQPQHPWIVYNFYNMATSSGISVSDAYKLCKDLYAISVIKKKVATKSAKDNSKKVSKEKPAPKPKAPKKSAKPKVSKVEEINEPEPEEEKFENSDEEKFENSDEEINP